MRLTIIRDDSVVGVGGVFRRVDLSSLPAGIRALQWDGTSGHLEYDEGANTPLESVADFQRFIDLWSAAAQPSISSAPASPAQMKAAALARINAAYENAMKALTAHYPEDEIRSWPKQEAEARAWLSDRSAPTPWIDAAATARGMSKAELVEKIIANAAAFVPAYGQLTGKGQKLRDEIAELGSDVTQQQLDAIQW
jgi:hypothetical protein